MTRYEIEEGLSCYGERRWSVVQDVRRSGFTEN